jgi:hypothetical protein
MAVTKLIVDMLFYYKRDINELEEFLFLTWAFYDLQRCQYSKRKELLDSWAMQNVTFIFL